MNSKAKGSGFEREICRKLSLWITRGKKSDVFWRSAMSGGRATVARNKGEKVRQSGDITAVAPEGHVLTDRFYIECRFYKDLALESFFLHRRGTLAKHWRQVRREAKSHDKEPWLVAKQNNRPILLLTETHSVTNLYATATHPTLPLPASVYFGYNQCQVWLLDELLQLKYQPEGVK